MLDRQRQQLEADISSAQARVDRAQQALTAAGATPRQSMNSRQSFARPAPVGSLRQTLGGGAQSSVQNQNAVDAARATLAIEQGNLDQARSQLNAVVQKLAALKSQASAIGARWGIDLGSARPAAASSAPPPTSSTPDLLVTIATLVRNDWMYMAAGVLVLLFVVSRVIRG